MIRRFDGGTIAKKVGAGFFAVALAIATMGASTQAFAAKADEEFEEEAEKIEGEAAVDEQVQRSSFRLGHVALECVAMDEADDSDSAVSAAPAASGVGESQERRYLITNQGEAAYVRLASHTVLGTLDHLNGRSVTEASAASEGLSEAGASEAHLSGRGDGLWRLAEDGFWYRSEPLEEGESLIVCVAVEIPGEQGWMTALNIGEPSDVRETLDIDALQARNAVIDWEASEPWQLVEEEEEAV